MDILQQIRERKLKNFDVFGSFELKNLFGKYYKIFEEAYRRNRKFSGSDYGGYSAYLLLNNMIDIIQKKIDIYNYSPDNLGRIDSGILAVIIDSDLKQAAKLIQSFKQPGVKASLKCFAMASNTDGYAFVLESLKTAGNQIGVFDTVFGGFRDTTEGFKKFIIPKVIEYQFYRYKTVVANIGYGYSLNYPIENAKEFIISLWEILSGNFQKYLDTKDGKTTYTLLNLLHRVNYKEYEKFFEKMLNSQNKIQRFFAFYYMSGRTDKLELADKYFKQDDLELYAPLLDCLGSYSNPNIYYDDYYQSVYEQKLDSNTVRLYKSLYPKLIGLWEQLPKKNNIFITTSDIWFSHNVREEEIISKIIHILKRLDDKSLIHSFEDNHYDKLSPSDKLLFITALKDRIKHNYRTEMLNYFTVTGYFNERYKKYFIENPLTYAEAVIVTDFLKTKKTDIKKNIVEHFMRMNNADRVKLKSYLEAAAEEYKRECALDIKTDAPQNMSKKAAGFPKFDLKDLKTSKIQEVLKAAKAVLVKNKDIEITLKGGEKALFGTQYWFSKNDDGKYYFEEEVNDVISSFNLTDNELASLTYVFAETDNVGATFLGEPQSNWQNTINSFLRTYFRNYIEKKQTASLQTEILKRFMNTYGQIKEFPKPDADRQIYYRIGEYPKKNDTPDARMLKTSNALAGYINYAVSDNKNLTDIKTIIEYVKENNAYNANPISDPILISKWYNAGIITKEEISSYLKCRLFNLSSFFETPYSVKNGNMSKDLDANIYNGRFSEEFIDIIENVQMEILETEILRAQAATLYTDILQRCKKYVGIKFYAAVLKAFQKMALPRTAYGYSATKDDIFALILARTEPHRKDTYEDFCRFVKENKLSEKDLIKGVLYSNNKTVLDWTAKLLNKPGFISCVMFFKAHLKDTEVSASVRDSITLFSPIAIEDFKEGAVDTDWFFAMKSEIDESTFNIVYDNAKHITVANFHKRAQRFSDALTGKLSKTECLDKINETRNKEFLLCYSLIPLKDDNDIKERYELVQKFLLESKQFGAQRQTSEKKSCEIALENIARTAGYEDTDRFIWYMESKEAKKIAPYFSPETIDGVEVSLQISDRFKVSVLVSKDGKELSAVPAKLKSHKYIAEMKEEIPPLNKQSSRVIKSLENAMERESVFLADEIKQIATNPVMKEILKALFFVAGKKIVLFDGADFVSLAGTKEQAEKLYIAHPLDFFNLKQWDAVQRYLLENKIRQPFKQAFREFYSKTIDEIDANETNRYHGHQISAQKAIAVAKNRGWHSGEDIGLQKVYYKENIVAVLFGVWDFGYSSFDDHPTISSVYFLNRKADETGAMKIIPFKEIKDKMFSEVMRDIDLIVSTAHPLGYDFEESLSTVEVRRQVCTTIIDLLGIKNVSIDGHHIRINGTYGEYAVNLKSGNAYKQLSGALNIISINDSTQNKLFLNFIDDNPKTAEVVSKMLLLSDDQKIKDPNIVREIKG